MKLFTAATTTVAIAVLTGASFAADTNAPRPPDGKGRGPRPDPAAAVAHLTAEYSKVSSFDLNRDGELDATEQGRLAAAITAGTVSFAPPGGRTPPAGFTPPAEEIARHLADMYTDVAPYDANADSVLSADEQATLKTAIESGELSGPGGPGGPGGHGCGGSGFPGGPDESEG